MTARKGIRHGMFLNVSQFRTLFGGAWKRRLSSVEMRKSLIVKGLPQVEVDPQGDPMKLENRLCRQDLAMDQC
ncbi:MAG: hypothetical protein FJ404_14130 [Verrucomicrobia bacterium]|nr:hypothetical protein [Verrucomicrobiota bacterium]